MDIYEKFLRAEMTARRLVQEVGMDDMAFPLVDIFFGLQNAHERIIERRVQQRCKTILRLQGIISDYRDGKLTKNQLVKMLNLEERHIDDLLSVEPGSMGAWVANGGVYE